MNDMQLCLHFGIMVEMKLYLQLLILCLQKVPFCGMRSVEFSLLCMSLLGIWFFVDVFYVKKNEGNISSTLGLES